MKNLLISLSLIGAAIAVVATGTSAFFSDSETSAGNTFAAGTLDLVLADGTGAALITEENLKPGDDGSKTIKIKNEGSINGESVVVSLASVSDEEVSCTEPEINDDDGADSCNVENASTDKGELCRNIHVRINDGETQVYPAINGEYGPFADATNVVLNRQLKAGKTHNISIDYLVNGKAGNEIQSDKCVFEIKATLNQEDLRRRD